MICFRFIRPFTGSYCKEFQRGGQLFSSDVKCRKGAEEADTALKLSKSDRALLVVAMESSDSEAEEESMEVDQDSNSDNGMLNGKTYLVHHKFTTTSHTGLYFGSSEEKC